MEEFNISHDQTTSKIDLSSQQQPNATHQNIFVYGTEISIVILIFTSLLSLVTITGNSVVLLAYFLEESLRKPLNYLIVSLSIIDLLSGIICSSIYPIYFTTFNWFFGETLCHIWVITNWTLNAISQHGTFLISLDRFLSIRCYKTYRHWRTHAKVIIMLFLTWMSALIFYLLIYIFLMEIDTSYVDDRHRCIALINRLPIMIMGVIYFWVPLISMSLMYWYVYWKAAKQAQRSASRGMKKTVSEQATSAAEPARSSILDINQSGIMGCWEDDRASSVTGADVDDGIDMARRGDVPACAASIKDRDCSKESFHERGNILKNRKHPSFACVFVPLEEELITRKTETDKELSPACLDICYGHGDVINEISAIPCEGTIDTTKSQDLRCTYSEEYGYQEVKDAVTHDTKDATNNSSVGLQSSIVTSTAVDRHSMVNGKRKQVQIPPLKPTVTIMAPEKLAADDDHFLSSPEEEEEEEEGTSGFPRNLFNRDSAINLDFEELAQNRVRKTFKLVLAILLSFLIYLPFWLLFTLSYLFAVKVPRILMDCGKLFFYANSTCTPFLYAYADPLFRKTMKRILVRDCQRNKHTREMRARRSISVHYVSSRL